MRINNRSLFSLEAIDFQKDNPAETIASIFQYYKNDPLKYNEEFLSVNIRKYVKTRFNINLKFIIDDEIWGYNAYACMSRISSDNILLFNKLGKELYEDYRKYILKITRNIAAAIANGTLGKYAGLSYKNARVGGIYGQYPDNLIAISREALRDMPPIALASTFLHELGHIWTGFEYMHVQTSRNAIMTATVNRFLEIEKEHEIVEFIVDINNVWGIDISTKPEDLQNKEDVAKVILGAMNYSFKNSMGYTQYDTNMIESIADQFMIRCGGAAGEVEWNRQSIAKYGVRNNEKYKNELSAGNIFFGSLYSIGGAIATAALAVSVPPMAIVTGFMALLGVGLIYGGAKEMDELNGWNYDNDIDRLKRSLREESIRLKQLNMSKEAINIVLTNLANMEKIINQMPPADNFSIRIMRLFSSRFSRQEAKKIYQQVNEELANNSLYVAAAKFKTL